MNTDSVVKTDPAGSDPAQASDAGPIGRDPAGAASFGGWLRQQREGREITLREIAETTKISMSYLQAFEEDRFEILPGSVFAKGFLRQYAQYVGLDAQEVVNFYISAQQDAQAPEDLLEPELETPRTSFFKLALLAAAVTVVVAVVIWLLADWNERAREPQPTEPQGAPLVEPAPPAAAAPVDEVPAAAEPAAAEPAAPALRVALDFSSECWVEVSVDGERQVSEIKIQGESLLLAADESVDLKIGDADAVTVEVNGYPLALGYRRGTTVRTLRIDLETAAALERDARGGEPGSVARSGEGER